jgi:integrase
MCYPFSMSVKHNNGLPTGSGLYWKRGTIYLKHQGKSYCTGTSDTGAAVRFKLDKIAQLHVNDGAPELARGVRVNELLDDYIANLESRELDAGAYQARKYDSNSYKAASRIDKHLRPAFGKLKPSELTSDSLLAWRDKRRRQSYSVVSINGDLRILRAALRRGTKTTPRKVNPLHIPDFGAIINEKAEKNAARTGIITDEQFQLVMHNASEHLKPVFVAVMYTGVRKKEITFVRRSNVNFDNNSILLNAGETKNGDIRVVPMNDLVKPILAAWEAQTRKLFPKTPWFFHQGGEQLGSFTTAWNSTLRRAGLRVPVLNEDGEQKTTKSKETGKLTKVWKNLVKFHDTRRTNVTEMDELEIQEKDIMRVSGHKNPSQSRKYNQSKKAAERVRLAQNKKLGLAVAVSDGSSVASVASMSDWKTRIRDLKEMLDGGLLTNEAYLTLVRDVIAQKAG